MTTIIKNATPTIVTANQPTEAGRVLISKYLAIKDIMDIERLRDSHAELLATAKALLRVIAPSAWGETHMHLVPRLQAAIVDAEKLETKGE